MSGVPARREALRVAGPPLWDQLQLIPTEPQQKLPPLRGMNRKEKSARFT